MHRARMTCLLVVATVSLALPASAQDRRPNEGPATVTLDVERAPLSQVLRRLCLERGFNFVADPRVLERAGDVCVVMKEVSFEEAIETLGEIHDLEVRLRGKIVTVRQRAEPVAPPRPLAPPPPHPKGEAPARTAEAKAPEPRPADARPSFDRETAKPSTPPRSELFKTEPEPSPSTPAAPKLDAPAPAPKSEKPEGLGPPPGSVLGTVIEVGPTSVKIKERAGDAREYFVPDARKDDLTLRGARITQALKFLKKGDQCALTYEVDDQRRYVITNIIGGPKRAASPTPIPGEELQPR